MVDRFILLAVLPLMAFLFSCGQQSPPKTTLSSSQIWVVVTPGWDSTRGSLFAFERGSEGWSLQSGPIAIVTGKNGLAPGRGLMPLPPSPQQKKQEGDLRSPAGIFPLGPVFGHADQPPGPMPYVAIGPHTRCIEARESIWYNEIISDDTVKADWPSADLMLRPDSLYEYGVFVKQNYDPVQPGSGSCIFFHAWSKPGRGTAGCTALEKNILADLTADLDSAKNPVLVQVPDKIYKIWGEEIDLPPLP